MIGVKLSADFASGAISEDYFQNILQVVETDRKKRPKTVTKPPHSYPKRKLVE